MPTRQILEAYRASRDPEADTSVLCHAPFLSLNFEQNGRVTSCCYNRSFVLGRYPDQTVGEIWRGSQARELRQAFFEDSEAPGCDLCFFQLKNRNFGGTLMRNFDRYARDEGYAPELDAATPRVLEFEIANTCNLECEMCAGHWSSAIRAHREHLPPLKSPYDRAFVGQLDEFLPSLVAAKFLGGEPFLIKRYYEIWERIRQVQPEAELSITTNGSIVPDRARELLEELRACISVSLDALTPSVYESIRKNARHEQVMANVEYFLDYTRRRGTWLTLTICPMTRNWQELPRLLAFCEEREIQLHFNTVLRPAEASLAGLSESELGEVVAHLAGYRPEGDAWWTGVNRGEWDGLVNQLRGWQEEKRAFTGRSAALEQRFGRFAASRAEPGPAPAADERLTGSLLRSLHVSRERAAVQHPDFLTLLPRPPLVLPVEAGATDTRALLLAAHRLWAFARSDAPGGATASDAELAEQQERLQGFLRLAEGAGGAPRLAAIGRWILDRARAAQTDTLLHWLGVLLETLPGRDGSPGALERGRAELRLRGLDADAARRVQGCFRAIAAARFGPEAAGWLLEPGAAGDGAAGEAASESAPPRLPVLGGLEDLARLADAAYLFQRCTEPRQDASALRGQLDAWLEAVGSAGKEGSVCSALAGRDPADVCHLLVAAPEGELAALV